MSTPEHVTLTPDAAPAPGPPPAWMADTDVQQVLKDDGSHHQWELTYRPTGTKVTSVDRDLAVSDLGEVLASRGEIADPGHQAEDSPDGHLAHGQSVALENAVTGTRYRVTFDDCCVSGSFEAAVRMRVFGDDDAETESVLFDNGVTLSGRRVRLEEVDG